MRDKLSPVADFRNKLFSFACLSSRSAATPFLIPKQPYFPHFPLPLRKPTPPPPLIYHHRHILSHPSLFRVHSESLGFSLRARLADLSAQTYSSCSQRSPSPSSSCSFRQRSSFLARVLGALCSLLIITPLSTLAFRSRCLHFSFRPRPPLPSLFLCRIIFVVERLIHSLRRRYLRKREGTSRDSQSIGRHEYGGDDDDEIPTRH